jgi:hypothetical protein
MTTPVQGNTASSGAVNSISVSWPSPTTANNYLVAVLGFMNGDPGTITPPTGFVQRGTTKSNGILFVASFEAVNAASQSGSQTFSFVNSPDDCAVCVEEYSAIVTVSPDDGFNSATGSGLSITAGSITTTNANDLVMGAALQGTESSSVAVVFTQSGSWTIRQQIGAHSSAGPFAYRLALLEQVVAGTGTYSAAVSSGVSDPWVATTFAVKATGAPAPPQPRQQVIAARGDDFAGGHPQFAE